LLWSCATPVDDILRDTRAWGFAARVLVNVIVSRLLLRWTGDARRCDDGSALACGGIPRAPHAFTTVNDDFARMPRHFRASNTRIVLGRTYIGAPVAHFHAHDYVMRLRGHDYAFVATVFDLAPQAIALPSSEFFPGNRLLPRAHSDHCSAHCAFHLQDWSFIPPHAELSLVGPDISPAARDIASTGRELGRGIHPMVLAAADFFLPDTDFFGSSSHFRGAIWHFRRRDAVILRSTRHIPILVAEIVGRRRDIRSGVWQFGLARGRSFSRA
jgi:hypothetical protein